MQNVECFFRRNELRYHDRDDLVGQAELADLEDGAVEDDDRPIREVGRRQLEQRGPRPDDGDVHLTT